MRLRIKMTEQERQVNLSICGLELSIDGMKEDEEITIAIDDRGVSVETDQPKTKAIPTIIDNIQADPIAVDDIHSDHAALLSEKAHASVMNNTISEEELFRKLAALRKQLAIEQSVPPYVIFNDKSLREMVQKLPEDLTSFGSISGVGKSKLERYGRIFLDTIQTYKGKMAS